MKINLGGGQYWEEKGWKNIDHGLGDDITKGLPFEDRTVSLIFFSHCLEHIKWEYVPFVLRECYRVLGTHGVMRIVVPDFDLFSILLRHDNKKYLIDNIPNHYDTPERRYLPLIDDVMEQMGEYKNSGEKVNFLSGFHKSFYTENILFILLRAAGFTRHLIWKSSFCGSFKDEMRKPAIRNPDNNDPVAGFDNIYVSPISLYMECQK